MKELVILLCLVYVALSQVCGNDLVESGEDCDSPILESYCIGCQFTTNTVRYRLYNDQFDDNDYIALVLSNLMSSHITKFPTRHIYQSLCESYNADLVELSITRPDEMEFIFSFVRYFQELTLDEDEEELRINIDLDEINMFNQIDQSGRMGTSIYETYITYGPLPSTEYFYSDQRCAFAFEGRLWDIDCILGNGLICKLRGCDLDRTACSDHGEPNESCDACVCDSGWEGERCGESECNADEFSLTLNSDYKPTYIFERIGSNRKNVIELSKIKVSGEYKRGQDNDEQEQDYEEQNNDEQEQNNDEQEQNNDEQEQNNDEHNTKWHFINTTSNPCFITHNTKYSVKLCHSICSSFDRIEVFVNITIYGYNPSRGKSPTKNIALDWKYRDMQIPGTNLSLPDDMFFVFDEHAEIVSLTDIYSVNVSYKNTSDEKIRLIYSGFKPHEIVTLHHSLRFGQSLESEYDVDHVSGLIVGAIITSSVVVVIVAGILLAVL